MKIECFSSRLCYTQYLDGKTELYFDLSSITWQGWCVIAAAVAIAWCLSLVFSYRNVMWCLLMVSSPELQAHLEPANIFAERNESFSCRYQRRKIQRIDPTWVRTSSFVLLVRHINYTTQALRVLTDSAMCDISNKNPYFQVCIMYH